MLGTNTLSALGVHAGLGTRWSGRWHHVVSRRSRSARYRRMTDRSGSRIANAHAAPPLPFPSHPGVTSSRRRFWRARTVADHARPPIGRRRPRSVERLLDREPVRGGSGSPSRSPIRSGTGGARRRWCSSLSAAAGSWSRSAGSPAISSRWQRLTRPVSAFANWPSSTRATARRSWAGLRPCWTCGPLARSVARTSSAPCQPRCVATAPPALPCRSWCPPGWPRQIDVLFPLPAAVSMYSDEVGRLPGRRRRPGLPGARGTWWRGGPRLRALSTVGGVVFKAELPCPPATRTWQGRLVSPSPEWRGRGLATRAGPAVVNATG